MDKPINVRRNRFYLALAAFLVLLGALLFEVGAIRLPQVPPAGLPSAAGSLSSAEAIAEPQGTDFMSTRWCGSYPAPPS